MPQVPPSKPLTHFKLLSFDVYGTLIDWETGITTAVQSSAPILPLPSSHPLKSRAHIARSFDDHERAVMQQHPGLAYPLIVAETYRRMLASAGVAVPAAELDGAAAAFADSVGDWPPFPDTVAALRALGRRYRLVPLSNVDRASFARTLAGPLRGVEFDAVYTAEDIGSYKPSHANFAYLFAHARSDFGVEQGEILHVAQSLHHDHVPAAAAGMRPGVWVARGGETGGVGAGLEARARYGWEVATLGALAELVEGEFAEETD